MCRIYKKNAWLSKFHPACEQTKILSLDQDIVLTKKEKSIHAILVTLHPHI
jgi:hypothetical protein